MVSLARTMRVCRPRISSKTATRSLLFKRLLKDRLQTGKRSFIDAYGVTRFGVHRIDLRHTAGTAITQRFNDIFADLGNLATEGKKILYTRRIARRPA